MSRRTKYILSIALLAFGSVLWSYAVPKMVDGNFLHLYVDEAGKAIIALFLGAVTLGLGATVWPKR